MEKKLIKKKQELVQKIKEKYAAAEEDYLDIFSECEGNKKRVGLTKGFIDSLVSAELKEFNELADQLYHYDMLKLKKSLPAGRWTTTDGVFDYYEKSEIPAESWVYLYQDEGGVYIYDENMDFMAEVDYSLDFDELFYNY